MTDPEGRTVWHRLGGNAEDKFNRRQAEGGRFTEPGRWCKVGNFNEDWVPWGSITPRADVPRELVA